MSEISVGNGWYTLIAEAIDEAATLPEEWGFEIVSATRADGALLIDARFNAFDVPVNELVPHPFRALRQMRMRARLKSLNTCELCGRTGHLRGEGDSARVRCDEHVRTGDDQAALEHFLADFGDGLDFMQELQAAARDEGAEGYDGNQDGGSTRH